MSSAGRQGAAFSSACSSSVVQNAGFHQRTLHPEGVLMLDPADGQYGQAVGPVVCSLMSKPCDWTKYISDQA